jgi:hypothetical protein
MTAEVYKRRRSPRTARVFGVLMVSMLALAGCVGQNSNNPGSGSSGATNKNGSHTLVIARNMDLIDTDPSTAICDTCQIIFAATYQTLVTLANDNHTLIPEVATSWSANTNLTADWVVSAQATGWNLLPLYVGLQAPCVPGEPRQDQPTLGATQESRPRPRAAAVKLTRPTGSSELNAATYTSVLNSKVVKATAALTLPTRPR